MTWLLGCQQREIEIPMVLALFSAQGRDQVGIQIQTACAELLMVK